MKRIQFDVKSGFIRFFRHENLVYLYTLSILAIVTYFLKCIMQITNNPMFDIYVAPMTVSLDMLKYLFVFFLFISFEYLYMMKASFLEETIGSIYQGIGRYECGSLIVCTAGALGYWIMFVVLNIGACVYLGMHDVKYYIHIVLVLFVFVFGVMELAVMLAWMAAKKFGRIMSYSVLISLIFFSSFYFEEITALLYDMGVNVYFFQELFAFLPTGLKFMPNFHNPFVLQPYQIALISSWILGAGAAAIAHKKFEQKSNKLYVFIVMLMMVSIGIYFMPTSKILMNENPKSTLMEGQNYYINNKLNKPNEYEHFQVLQYNMELNIGSQLENSVKISVAPNYLKCYAFTLFHGYKIEKIENQDGERLRFSREQDYIYIHNDDQTNISEINIQYKGSSSTYYSNRQGVYLPGDFPYYPQPGIRNVYNQENYSYDSVFLEHEVYFEIKIKGADTIYSDLPNDDSELYKGYCSGPIFLKGFLKEYVYQDICVVYPYLNQTFSEETLQTWIVEIKEELGNSCPDNIFIEPNLNQQKVLHIGTDYVITPYLFGANEYKSEMRK